MMKIKVTAKQDTFPQGCGIFTTRVECSPTMNNFQQLMADATRAGGLILGEGYSTPVYVPWNSIAFIELLNHKEDE